MSKLIMPKHTGELVYFKTPLKVYYENSGWISMDDFTDKLYEELVAIGKETSRSHDNSHYTKCAQLPKYFGFVTRNSNGRSPDTRITDTGKMFYEALLRNDEALEYRLLVEAFEKLTFGRNSEGCGSDSDVEPIGVFFRAVYALGGVSCKEYGFILGELSENNRILQDVLQEVEEYRQKHIPVPVKSGTVASNLSDCKTMKLLKELNFLVENENGDGRMTVSPNVDNVFRDRLKSLRITNSFQLKTPFKCWLKRERYSGSIYNYPNSIEAVSIPLSTPMKKNTSRWEGVYEYVMGHPPRVEIFSVRGRHHFDSIYGEFSNLLTKKITPPVYGVDSNRHQELIDYTLRSGGEGVVDNARLYNANIVYKKFLSWFDFNKGLFGFTESKGDTMDNRTLAAIRTKPFILLAGISGTGKSRMVRQLARGCCPKYIDGSEDNHSLYNEQKPGNFEMISVRPNWHDSTELMGYISRISGKPEYVITDFIRFLAKAWLYEKENIPFFLCLDEMNLAPVEQYFAEYLSVIETRKKDDNGKIVTDTLVKISDEPLLEAVIDDVYKDVEHNTAEKFKSFFVSKGGIPIPSNLVVMGTVNMDETTCTFSRKVLDRAMSFEINDVSDMYDINNISGEGDYEFGSIDCAAAKQNLLTGKDAIDKDSETCKKILDYLKVINEVLDKTAFKIAYRSRNEIMIYCIERTHNGIVSLAQALDEATSMKILSRIEGDSQHVTEDWLGRLSDLIKTELAKIGVYDESKCSVCSKKLEEMKEQVSSGYTSFWMR